MFQMHFQKIMGHILAGRDGDPAHLARSIGQRECAACRRAV